jgi:hypothetical protein
MRYLALPCSYDRTMPIIAAGRRRHLEHDQ